VRAGIFTAANERAILEILEEPPKLGNRAWCAAARETAMSPEISETIGPTKALSRPARFYSCPVLP
jgi:hypothetical protein